MSENTTASNSPGVPVEDPTPFGLLTTADHKRIGRLFVVSSLFFLVLGLALDLLVRADLTSGTDFVVFDADSFAQGFALSRETLTLLFLIPAFLGLGASPNWCSEPSVSSCCCCIFLDLDRFSASAYRGLPREWWTIRRLG